MESVILALVGLVIVLRAVFAAWTLPQPMARSVVKQASARSPYPAALQQRRVA